MINLTGERGSIALGIPINATVERVLQTYRRRRLRTYVLLLIKQEILRLQALWPNQQKDSVLWKQEIDDFREGFSSSQTWKLTRMQGPNVSWVEGIWFKEAIPKFSFLTWLAAHNRLYRQEIGFSGGILEQYPLAGCATRVLRQETTYFCSVPLRVKWGEEQ